MKKTKQTKEEYRRDPRRNQLKKRLCPGLWIDQADGLHTSIPELLADAGIPDTPANRIEMSKMAEELVREIQPNIKIIHRKTPKD